MSLADLESLPRDPGNRVADDPRAAELGRRLFSDTLDVNVGAVHATQVGPDGSVYMLADVSTANSGQLADGPSVAGQQTG